MTDIKFEKEMTPYAKYLLTALLCEKMGFWPDITYVSGVDANNILDYKHIVDSKVTYEREVTENEFELKQICHDLVSYPEEHWDLKYRDLHDGDNDGWFNSCHIAVTIDYRRPSIRLRWFYAHDDNYQERIIMYATHDVDVIIDVLLKLSVC